MPSSDHEGSLPAFQLYSPFSLLVAGGEARQPGSGSDRGHYRTGSERLLNIPSRTNPDSVSRRWFLTTVLDGGARQGSRTTVKNHRRTTVKKRLKSIR